MSDELISRLSSDSSAERTRATYELDYANFREPAVLAATRANLEATDPELLAITVMRLLIRGKDVSSWEKVVSILRHSNDDYVISSAVLALANLATSFPALAEATIAEVEALPTSRIAAESRASLASALAELRATARQ